MNSISLIAITLFAAGGLSLAYGIFRANVREAAREDDDGEDGAPE